jgi:hypothetical protein
MKTHRTKSSCTTQFLSTEIAYTSHTIQASLFTPTSGLILKHFLGLASLFRPCVQGGLHEWVTVTTDWRWINHRKLGVKKLVCEMLTLIYNNVMAETFRHITLAASQASQPQPQTLCYEFLFSDTLQTNFRQNIFP